MARTKTETSLPTQDFFLQKLGFSTVYKSSPPIRERSSSAPWRGRQVPCVRSAGSLLTAGVGPGPQLVQSIAAGPSVGKLSKYHQGRGTFTSSQSSALGNKRQRQGRWPPHLRGAVVFKAPTAYLLGAPTPRGKQGHLCRHTLMWAGGRGADVLRRPQFPRSSGQALTCARPVCPAFHHAAPPGSCLQPPKP